LSFAVALPTQAYQDITNLRHLPVADKLRLVTQLWDEIAASTDPIVVPPAILQEASRRSAELKEN